MYLPNNDPPRWGGARLQKRVWHIFFLKNLASTLVDKGIINMKLLEELKNRRVEEIIDPTPLFISSSQSLIPKHDKGWRMIHSLFYIVGHSVNDYIPDGVIEMKYSQF